MFILVVGFHFGAFFFKKRSKREGIGRENAALLRSASTSIEIVNKKLGFNDTVKWGGLVKIVPLFSIFYGIV